MRLVVEEISSDPVSTYALFTRALSDLMAIWPLKCIPTTNDYRPYHTLLRSIPQVSYHTFLFTLKAWAQHLGFRREAIATHSRRHGLSSNWALIGIPPHIRRMHAR